MSAVFTTAPHHLEQCLEPNEPLSRWGGDRRVWREGGFTRSPSGSIEARPGQNLAGSHSQEAEEEGPAEQTEQMAPFFALKLKFQNI